MTSTGARLWAWGLRHRLAILGAVAVVAFVAVTFATTFRLYDERQLRLNAIAEQALMNRMINTDLCQGLNAANETIRFVLDAGLRLRSPDNPIGDGLRAAYVDAYRRLPHTNCDTGAKTFFDPPFPERTNP
jgi:hypothetical protein